MIDRIAGAEAAATRHIGHNHDQRARESDPAARGGDNPATGADAPRGPSTAEAERVAEIAALRDEALATSRAATEFHLATQARGERVPTDLPAGHEATRATPEAGARAADVEATDTVEAERRRAEVSDLARRIRDGTAGAPHGGGAKVDVSTIRALLGS